MFFFNASFRFTWSSRSKDILQVLLWNIQGLGWNVMLLRIQSCNEINLWHTVLFKVYIKCLHQSGWENTWKGVTYHKEWLSNSTHPPRSFRLFSSYSQLSRWQSAAFLPFLKAFLYCQLKTQWDTDFSVFSNDLFSLKYTLDGYLHDIAVKTKTLAKSNWSKEDRITVVIFSCQYVLLFIHLTVYPPHVTQVPQDDWGGYPGDGKDDEIPCRRMRSSSYVKAMGDEESGESDSSPKTSPQKSVRPDALVKAIIRPRDLLDSQRYSTCNLKIFFFLLFHLMLFLFCFVLFF